VFHLLRRRTERDQYLFSALLRVSSRQEDIPRRNTALVKLLSGMLQNLDQMRTLSIVEEAPNLSSEIDACTSLIKAKRCFRLAQTYATEPNRLYGEAIALSQRASLHIREARSSLVIVDSKSPLLDAFTPSQTQFATFEAELASQEEAHKREWFAYNGGRVGTQKAANKPLFFDIALNYVDLNMDNFKQKAGIPVPDRPSAIAMIPTRKAPEPHEQLAPEPVASTSRLSNLLGGWWGRG